MDKIVGRRRPHGRRRLLLERKQSCVHAARESYLEAKVLEAGDIQAQMANLALRGSGVLVSRKASETVGRTVPLLVLFCHG